LILRECVQKLSPNFCGRLLATVAEKNDADVSLRREPDPRRCVWQTTVLIENRKIAGGNILPGESLPEVRKPSVTLSIALFIING